MPRDIQPIVHGIYYEPRLLERADRPGEGWRSLLDGGGEVIVEKTYEAAVEAALAALEREGEDDPATRKRLVIARVTTELYSAELLKTPGAPPGRLHRTGPPT